MPTLKSSLCDNTKILINKINKSIAYKLIFIIASHFDHFIIYKCDFIVFIKYPYALFRRIYNETISSLTSKNRFLTNRNHKSNLK